MSDTSDLDEARVIVCNYREATTVAVVGARAYVVNVNWGSGGDRVEVYARSRGSRWVKKWEDSTRLKDFRIVTLVKSSVPRRVWDRITVGGSHREPYVGEINVIERLNQENP